MQHPLIDEIFEKLHPYDSVFKKILDQAEKQEKECNTQFSSRGNISGAMFELTKNENNGLKQKRENEFMGHKQVDERSKPNSNDEECVDVDQVHNIPFVEKRIAKELRKCCNLFGIEIREKLRLSAKHFLELGKVYLNYAVNEDWEQQFVNDSEREERMKEPRKIVREIKRQPILNFVKAAALIVGAIFRLMVEAIFRLKVGAIFRFEKLKDLVRKKQPRKLFREIKSQKNLNFVKAAALTVGAIVRYEIMKDPEHIQIAKTELCRLHREIMKTDYVKGHRNVDILTFTKEIKRTLELHRRKIAVELENIAQMQGANSEAVAQDNVGMRDFKVREICEQCTKYYLDIMAKVAEKSERIIGKPPCKYSIIGLGSLARKEVTLYSDFEHAILLEDGIGDYSEAAEYFRWFSTIFQVIIIGLGETVIPSVGVKSLNDFYSSDERKNWFRDEYTPCGVSFDGMMPHACKNPVGRQEPTKHRSHTVELIQPVSKMVNFLTKEEEVKNGYFLSDILSKVCLAFGSREVYDDYLQKAFKLLKSRTQEEIAEQQLSIIERNPNLFVRNSDPFNFISDGKIKTSSYRPLTTLLSCAAALHSLPAKSSFKIVDEMRSRGIIDNQMCGKLISAVATAMEIRLRTYLEAGNQRTTVTTMELEEQVGSERLMNCYLNLNILRNWLREYLFENMGGIPSFAKRFTDCFELFEVGPGENSLFEFTVLGHFKNYERAMWSGIGAILQTVQRFRNYKMTALEGRKLLRLQFVVIFSNLLRVFKKDNNATTQDVRYPPILSPGSEHWDWLCGISKCYDNELTGWLVHNLRYEVYNDQRMLEDARREGQEACRFLIAVLKREVSTGTLDLLNKISLNKVVELMDPNECLQHLNELLNDANDFANRCKLRIGICEALLKKEMKKHARERLHVLVTDIEKNAKRIGQHLFHVLLSEILAIQNVNDFIVDSIPTINLLRYNTHVEEPNKVLNCSPSIFALTLEIPLQWRMLTAYNATSVNTVSQIAKLDPDQLCNKFWGGLEKVFSAFSRKTMIEEINCLIKSGESFRSDKGPFNQASCLMVLCEAVHATDLNLLIDFLRSSPYQVRSRSILQPFLYAVFADFLQHQTDSTKSFSVQKTTCDQLLKIASKQGDVIQALFGYPLKGGNLHNLAITYFREFRFVKCAKLCWKQLNRCSNDPTLQERSMKLFLTTVLTTVVFQKRRSPAKDIYITYEISLRQILLMFDKIINEPICSLMLAKLNEFHSYFQCNIEDKEKALVQVFYLATICSFTSPLKAVILLWKIVHAPKVTDPVLRYAIFLITSVVSRINYFRVDPISCMAYGAKQLSRLIARSES